MLSTKLKTCMISESISGVSESIELRIQLIDEHDDQASKLNMSKQPQSGLRTFQRNFSSSPAMSIPSSSQLTDDDMYWTATPPPPPPPKKVLSGHEQRLKDIQDALAGLPVQKQTRPLANSSSQVVNKRPNPTTSAANDEPPTKKRQLPTSWTDAPLSTSMPSKRAIASSASSKVNTSLITPTTVAVSKPAPVFLSQEQTEILKLVLDGNSVFYTGSAGTFWSGAYSHLLQFAGNATQHSYVVR